MPSVVRTGPSTGYQPKPLVSCLVSSMCVCGSVWVVVVVSAGRSGMETRRGPKPVVVELSPEERERLERWARRRKSSQALALRCRIVLGAAEGMANVDIAAELGCHAATVGKWRRRFAERRLDGLSDDPRPGPPRRIVDTKVEEVLVKTLEETPAGATHWSTRQMARATGISASSVSKIWRAFGLQPHRTEDFKISPDPQFVEKVHDLVGWYLNPPRRGGGAQRGPQIPDTRPGPNRAHPAPDARHT